jgi:hypothetical protein
VSVVLVAICAMRPAAGRAANPPLPVPGAQAVGDAVHAALRDFREGRRPRTHCPGCAALVLVLETEPRSTRVTTTCACGACDGTYELTERR